MKTLRLLVLLAALIFAGVAAPSRARADDDAVSFDYFYDSLVPYGEWVEVGDYGLCWRPTNVDPDWTPYSDGYWAYTDAGWTWVSYEDFGGIVYHYGRWLHLDDDSWCWTPGYDWAPAWVSWRSNDDYVGWAPLPPEAHWAQDTGISVWVDNVCDIGPGYYNFCHVRDFGAPVLRGVLCRRSDNIVIIRNTINVTNITYNTTYVGGPVIFNGGPRFEVINRVVVQPIPTLKLVQNANFDAAHWRDHRGPDGRMGFGAQTVGNELIVAAPRVLRPTDPGVFKARVKRLLPGESVTKGWEMVKNPQERHDLHQEMQKQAKGLTPQTAPARKVAATDLQAVPTKANPMAVTPGGDRHERLGNGQQRPETAGGQRGNTPNGPQSGAPNTPEGAFRDHSHITNVPPTVAPGGNGLLKPFNPNAETQPRPGPQGGPSSNEPRGSNSTQPIAPNNGRGRPEVSQQQQQQDAARMRAEEEQRAAQERAAQERASQERSTQEKRAEMTTQQQQEKAAQQEAARNQAEERRRAATEQQQQRQEQNKEQQAREQQAREQQAKEQQMQRNNEARREQEAAAERDRERERQQQAEQQRNAQQHQPPPSQGHPSKEGKDKEKDKDKNGN